MIVAVASVCRRRLREAFCGLLRPSVMCVGMGPPCDPMIVCDAGEGDGCWPEMAAW